MVVRDLMMIFLGEFIADGVDTPCWLKTRYSSHFVPATFALVGLANATLQWWSFFTKETETNVLPFVAAILAQLCCRDRYRTGPDCLGKTVAGIVVGLLISLRVRGKHELKHCRVAIDLRAAAATVVRPQHQPATLLCRATDRPRRREQHAETLRSTHVPQFARNADDVEELGHCCIHLRRNNHISSIMLNASSLASGGQYVQADVAAPVISRLLLSESALVC
jgi:hypothetical protein